MLRIVMLVLGFAGAGLMAAPALAQSSEISAWVRGQRSCEGLRAYLRDFPRGRYSDNAFQELARRRCPPVAQTPPAPPSSAPDAQKTATPATPPPPAAPPADVCATAREYWQVNQRTMTPGSIRVFLSAVAPASCTDLRAEAENRIVAIEAEWARVAAANEAEEKQRRFRQTYEGAWVSQTAPTIGLNCGGFPWRFETTESTLRPGSHVIRVTLADGSTDSFQVLSTSPVRIGAWLGNVFHMDTVFEVLPDGTMRMESSRITCHLRRQ